MSEEKLPGELALESLRRERARRSARLRLREDGPAEEATMTEFFVYYNFGICTHGDHSCGVESFPTEAGARAREAEIRRREYGPEVVVIEGRRLAEAPAPVTAPGGRVIGTSAFLPAREVPAGLAALTWVPTPIAGVKEDGAGETP